ncbi:glycoside hydrolase family 63 protein [Paxillus rubicundulus Ve08.2h10]|uniref:Mannosyl-oligosaccharide glucosidase n=1 Tax=Paxillus rubicundulus Ve08.2h10 TaxID=930991 RepID=A0A0D0C9Y6_9AGAM|nr:glycoside hydrolase family 63 protein [Paxillus rubicundulus Ve08.2h10]
MLFVQWAGFLLFWLSFSTAFTLHENVTEDLQWGAYRPGLYFGLRPRLPQSLLTGLIWFGTQNYQSLAKTRHACDQGDGLDTYTWTTFDPRQGGVQVLRDSPNNVEITTELLKVPGGQHGGSWAARVKGKPIDPAYPSRISTIFYVGLEGLGGIDLITDEDEHGIDGPIEFSGATPDLDEFTIRIVDGFDNRALTTGPHSEVFADRLGKSHFVGLRVDPGQVWTAKEFIMQSLLKRAGPIAEQYRQAEHAPDPSFVLQLPDETVTASNLFAVQKLFDGEFEFDVFFESSSASQKLDSSTIDHGIAALLSSFNHRFEAHFPTPESFAVSDYEGLQTFSKAITSNLLGGVGYFYGNSIVDQGFAYEWDQEDEDGYEDEDEIHEDHKGARITEPRALLTATPSRSFFPRGFYWDEGFHLLHIGEWDNDLSLEILKDWINLIDENGWVAREQILGDEARSRVPPEFQTQVPTFANPPTLTMAVTAFIDRLKARNDGPSAVDLGMDYGMGSAQIPFTDFMGSPQVGNTYLSYDKGLDFLRSIYVPLKRHYDWFRRTQRGQIKQYGRRARSRTEAYRWRGRSETHVLTSGMDDYPRGPPHAGELHLDLISWMGFFTRTMRGIAEFIGEAEDAESFREIEKAVIDNIDDLHWDEDAQMYCDVGVNGDDESEHVCHKGYLSLFPFMLSLLPPDSPHLGPILDLLQDPNHLWSPHGIRSLSASHLEFGQGENYWKGPIWIQMNYMVLSSLYKTYAVAEGPYQERAKGIYGELRKNVVENVYREYQRTGYVWEQYDALTGEGRRSHPFTGWTSLITLIISEKY